MSDDRLRRRVARAAEETLVREGLVTPVNLLIGLGWLHPTHPGIWQQGRVADLEQLVQVGPDRVTLALVLLHEWAADRGLEPSEVAYQARSPGREPLCFSVRGDDALERAFRTQWLSPQLSGRERERLLERSSKPPGLLVIQPLKEFTCALCGADDASLLIMQQAGPVCMACAGLDHLVFLPSGNAALTRRAKAASGLSAVVVRFSRSRRRYERQGLLVEQQALERDEAASLADM